jgi:hypothetical protein
MNLTEDLRASLQDILVSGSAEIRENGGRVTSASPLSWEVRGNSQKAAASPLVGKLQRHPSRRHHRQFPATVWLSPSSDSAASSLSAWKSSASNTLPPPRDLSREAYCEQLRRILAEQFPDESLEKICVAQDLEHSLSKI